MNLIKNRLRKLLPMSIWNRLIKIKATVKSFNYYLYRVFLLRVIK